MGLLFVSAHPSMEPNSNPSSWPKLENNRKVSTGKWFGEMSSKFYSKIVKSNILRVTHTYKENLTATYVDFDMNAITSFYFISFIRQLRSRAEPLFSPQKKKKSWAFIIEIFSVVISYHVCLVIQQCFLFFELWITTLFFYNCVFVSIINQIRSTVSNMVLKHKEK